MLGSRELSRVRRFIQVKIRIADTMCHVSSPSHSWEEMVWNVTGDVTSGAVDTQELCHRLQVWRQGSDLTCHLPCLQTCRYPGDVQHAGHPLDQVHGDVPQVPAGGAALLPEPGGAAGADGLGPWCHGGPRNPAVPPRVQGGHVLAALQVVLVTMKTPFS